MKRLFPMFVMLSLAGCAAPVPPAESVEPGAPAAALTAPVCSDPLVAVSRKSAVSLDSIRSLLKQGEWQNARLLPAETEPTLTNSDIVQRGLIRLYPRELRDARKGGTVMQFLVIDAAGVPKHKRVIASSGYLDLDLASSRVADLMRFSPGLVGGCRVASAVVIPITWSAH